MSTAESKKWFILHQPLIVVILFCLFFIQAIDFSKDYAHLTGVALLDWFAPLRIFMKGFQFLLLFSFAGLVIYRFFLVRVVKIPKGIFIPSAMLSLFLIIGFTAGILGANQINYVFGETLNWGIYLLIPLFIGLFCNNQLWKVAFLVLVWNAFFVTLKMSLSFIIDFKDHIPYLRILVYNSMYLLPFFFFTLAMCLRTTGKKRLIYFGLLSLAITMLFLCRLRGYYLAIGLALPYFLSFKIDFRYLRNLGLALVTLFFGVTLVFFFNDISLLEMVGFDQTLSPGLLYRLEQVSHLFSNFIDAPIFGKGFGLVLQDFKGYHEGLSKPYLQELDWINLLAKTGFLGGICLVLSFSYSLIWMRQKSLANNNPLQSSLIQALASTLLALLVVSLTNTMLSSFQFYMFFLLCNMATASIAFEEKTAEMAVAHA